MLSNTFGRRIQLQAITWANVDTDLCRYVALLGHTELRLVMMMDMETASHCGGNQLVTSGFTHKGLFKADHWCIQQTVQLPEIRDATPYKYLLLCSKNNVMEENNTPIVN